MTKANSICTYHLYILNNEIEMLKTTKTSQ